MEKLQKKLDTTEILGGKLYRHTLLPTVFIITYSRDILEK